jgi:acyl-CoA synthetase (AMP-forming)/AMP-acid ligase II
MIPHRVLSAVMQNTIHGFGIDERCIFLNVRPLWPVAQVIVMAYLMAGAHVVLAKRFDADQFADQIAQSGATRSSLVPTQLVRLVEVLSAHDPRFNTLEAVHVGGSQIPPPVFERALELLGPKIGVLYGLTEAPITCYLPPRRFAEEPTRQHELVRSVGRPLLGYEVCVDSDAGPTAQSGVRGEVMVRGANVMDGYWHDEAASTASLQQGWLRTGDIGTFGASGDLAIVGRLKEVIRTGATSVDPREVEETIGALPGVAEVAVVGVPDEEWGEAVTAFVAPAAGATLSVDVIIEHCRAHLAGYKKPRAVHVVASLPRSHYGKVLRAELIASVSVRKGD